MEGYFTNNFFLSVNIICVYVWMRNTDWCFYIVVRCTLKVKTCE